MILTTLLLTKPGEHVARLRDYLALFGNVAIITGRPYDLMDYMMDRPLILSYLYHYRVPTEILQCSRRAVNFHPAPPDYPGVGGTNWALYEEMPMFGVTVHEMTEAFDAGSIYDVVRFPIYSAETVWSLTQRAYTHLLVRVYEWVPRLLNPNEIPVLLSSSWGRYRTREELNALAIIPPGANDEEIRRRVRAMAWPGRAEPYIELAGMRFVFEHRDQVLAEASHQIGPNRSR